MGHTTTLVWLGVEPAHPETRVFAACHEEGLLWQGQ